MADWNRTHLFNSNWPPPARFHDAQGILLGSLLGAGGLYFPLRGKGYTERDLALGALLPSLFWIARRGELGLSRDRRVRGGVPGEGSPNKGSVGQRALLQRPDPAQIAVGYRAEHTGRTWRLVRSSCTNRWPRR